MKRFKDRVKKCIRANGDYLIKNEVLMFLVSKFMGHTVYEYTDPHITCLPILA